MKIGVVGAGVVGSAVIHHFAIHDDVVCHDIIRGRSTHGLDEVLESDFVFVCLPTPPTRNGGCDVSRIEDFFARCSGLSTNFILKSTVAPGTTDRLAKRFDLKSLVHSPEFLSRRSAAIDFAMPIRIVIGRPGSDAHINAACPFRELFRTRFPGAQILETRAVESEFIKYFSNCYGAATISFMNEMRLISDKLSCDWQRVVEGVLAGGCIPRPYSRVPGPDGQFGYGGPCLPKDVAALIAVAKELDIAPIMLAATRDRNSTLRTD